MPRPLSHMENADIKIGEGELDRYKHQRAKERNFRMPADIFDRIKGVAADNQRQGNGIDQVIGEDAVL